MRGGPDRGAAVAIGVFGTKSRVGRGMMRLAALLTGIALLFCERSKPLPEHDFIFISIDTLRADHLPFYGYGRTTSGTASERFSLAWLAEQGEVWEQCWSPVGKTLPALGSFWTGEHPLEHGAVANSTPLQASSRARRFQRRGYHTVARVANRALGAEMGLADGFEDYALAPGAQEGSIPVYMMAAAAPAIAAGEPLMLWAHFMAPHQPYAPPPAYQRRFMRDDEALDPLGSNEVLSAFHHDPDSLTPDLHQHMVNLYDAEIVAAAAWVRQLLSSLDQAYADAGRGGLLDNAVVVFFSDHGEELGERAGYFMHAKSLYRGVLRVPLVIAGPGHSAGRRTQPIALEEVLPWVLDQRPPAGGPFYSSWQTQFYGVRDARWTLLHNPCANPLGPLEPPVDAAYPYAEVALYDRSVDANESNDVAAAHPQEVRRLLGLMRSWYQDLERPEPRFLGQDPQARQQILANLGYLDEVPDEVCPPWRAQDWKP